MSTRLSTSALKTLSSHIPVPKYSRTKPAAIVHVGVGNFCRAHLFENTHKYNQNCKGNEWLIHGVGVLNNSSEREAFKKMESSEYLYGLLTLPSKSAEIIGSMCSYDWVPNSAASLENAAQALSSPDSRIISLTITEKGYCTDTNGNIDFENADLMHDVQTLKGGDRASSFKTALGLVVEGLSRRQEANAGPITILSCDNLPSNGDALRSILSELISATRPELLEYTTNQVTFPNSMVDRITPGVTDDTVRLFEAETNVFDPLPVVAEDFTQWVVEDNFIAGRPKWEAVEENNILFVDDCEPYEAMKLGLLNASHTAMAYVSILAGHEKVDQSMGDEDVYNFVKTYMDMATSTVPDVPGVDLEEYKETLRYRFCNLSDDLSRLAQDGSKKMIGFVLPSLVIKLENGESTEQIAGVVASWICYLNQFPDLVDDPRSAELIDLGKLVVESCSRPCDGEAGEATRTFVHATLGGLTGTSEQFMAQIEEHVYDNQTKGAESLLQKSFSS